MDIFYRFANASLTLRTVERLAQLQFVTDMQVTIVHQPDGWILRLELDHMVCPLDILDLRSFLSELGEVYEPKGPLKVAFWGLDVGESPISVMRQQQVAIVSYGLPNRIDIEEFCKEFIAGLGYCPATLV
ncbi:MAG: hypothetical protein AAF685_15320 [Cyanobacteria bacterium P01_C01_bin.89]